MKCIVLSVGSLDEKAPDPNPFAHQHQPFQERSAKD